MATGIIISGFTESILFFIFTGGVPVAPGYGGGYPQQYYQGTTNASPACVLMLMNICSVVNGILCSDLKGASALQ